MSKFPERLKYLRKLKDVTQVELGKHLGYGYTAISNYENFGNEASYDTLMKMADYFEVSIDFLIGYDDFLEPTKCIPEEIELIEKYRELNDSDKDIIIALVDSMARK